MLNYVLVLFKDFPRLEDRVHAAHRGFCTPVQKDKGVRRFHPDAGGTVYECDTGWNCSIAAPTRGWQCFPCLAVYLSDLLQSKALMLPKYPHLLTFCNGSFFKQSNLSYPNYNMDIFTLFQSLYLCISGEAIRKAALKYDE